MTKIIHLTDNLQNPRHVEGSETVADILRIANIGQLKNRPDLLVFPHSFSESDGNIHDLTIVNARNARLSDSGRYSSVYITTGNLMGFVGVNSTSLSIHSRFTRNGKGSNGKDCHQDYFLYYMLHKVLSVNILSLDHASNRYDKMLDFLLFLFPSMLKSAMSQGLYKEYTTQQHDDARVRGVVDVNRVIRNDIPFQGRISYSTRQHGYDNSVTQLIRHTIEYIRQHPLGASILANDRETKECVSQIIGSTPSYNRRDREKTLMLNLRPKVHPYFLKYKELQQLCVHILRHESLKYGQEENKVHGILFDGAWLWEEYLYTILKELNFKHPMNKESKGGLRMFEKTSDEDYFDNNSRRIYPDFYRDGYIIDAKYKRLSGNVGREDLYQVISYMYCMDAPLGGYVYPDDGHNSPKRYKLSGKGSQYPGNEGGIISVIPFKVPGHAADWTTFVAAINDSEKNLAQSIQPIKAL